MRPIVLLSDFGRDDHYTGVLHAVLMRDAPAAERLDLVHGVPRGDIWAGCFFLRAAWPYLPDAAVVLAVVDPGVGGARRPLAVRVGSRWLVAPDNGLAAACGPATAPRTSRAVVVLEAARMGLPEPSATFHGRDLFAPAAARLARGEPAAALGTATSPSTLCPCPLPEPVSTADRIRGAIIHVDIFGNLVTNLPADAVPASAVVTCGQPLRRVGSYGEGRRDEVVVLEGSSGYLELAVNCGSAAATLAVGRGHEVEATTRGVEATVTSG